MISFAACQNVNFYRRESGRYKDSTEMQSLGDSDNANTDRVTLFTNTLQSCLIGYNLQSLSLRDLILLEQQVHGILRRVGAKKDELILEQLEDIKEEMCVVHSSCKSARQAESLVSTVSFSVLVCKADLCCPAEGFCLKVRKSWRTTNASSNILEKLVDSCPSHVTGSRHPEGQGKC
eukprot:c25011_g1_i1 orf=2-532(+)